MKKLIVILLFLFCQGCNDKEWYVVFDSGAKVHIWYPAYVDKDCASEAIHAGLSAEEIKARVADGQIPLHFLYGERRVEFCR